MASSIIGFRSCSTFEFGGHLGDQDQQSCKWSRSGWIKIILLQHNPDEEHSAHTDIFLLWDLAPHISAGISKALQPWAPLQQPCEPALLPSCRPQFSRCSGELMADVPSCMEDCTWEGPSTLQYSVLSQKLGESRAGKRGLPECIGVSPTTV